MAAVVGKAQHQQSGGGQHHQPHGDVDAGHGRCIPMQRRQGERQVDQRVEPGQQQIAAVTHVENQATVIHHDTGHRAREADQQHRHSEHPACRASGGPPRRQRQRQGRQHGHQKPRRRAVAAPPHTIGRHGQQVGHGQQHDFHSEPRRLPGQRSDSKHRQQQHRRRRKQPELLIEEQPGNAWSPVRQRALRIAPVGRGRHRCSVGQLEKDEPRGGRHHGHGEEARAPRPAPRLRPEAREHQQAGDAGGQSESRVQPRQQGQRRTDRHEYRRRHRLAPMHPHQQPQCTDEHHGPGRIGKDGEPVEEHWHTAHHPEGGHPCGPSIGCHAEQQLPQQGGPQAREDDHQHDRTLVAGQGVGGGDQRRHAGRMDRIDASITPPAEVVGLQFAAKVRQILAARMVVVDGQVTVVEQALRDDEIVRLVTGRQPVAHLRPADSERRRTQHPGHQGTAGSSRGPSHRTQRGPRKASQHQQPDQGQQGSLPQREGRWNLSGQQGQPDDACQQQRQPLRRCGATGPCQQQGECHQHAEPPQGRQHHDAHGRQGAGEAVLRQRHPEREGPIQGQCRSHQPGRHRLRDSTAASWRCRRATSQSACRPRAAARLPA